ANGQTDLEPSDREPYQAKARNPSPRVITLKKLGFAWFLGGFEILYALLSRIGKYSTLNNSY
ncbi:MAG: hypothetical protein WD607_06460, partial [Candidatus Paceibacterota bacterium]